jgi:hypothetical protein
MANYSRKCRDCERWINLRQMPHGRYVAFEGDEPHNCSKGPAGRSASPARPTASRPVEGLAKPFTPLYPKVPEPPARDPSPIRPVPPRATPRPIPSQQPAPSTSISRTPTAYQPPPAEPGTSWPSKIGIGILIFLVMGLLRILAQHH